MKIGIITILKVNNYGAELQAYATQAFLKKIGHDAEIIDYLFYKNPQHIRTKLSAAKFRFPLKQILAEHIYPILQKIKMIPYRASDKIRTERFYNFHLKNTSLSKTYYTIDSLYADTMDYDVYLTGSDQVWNPYIYSSLAPYFLDFAPEGKKKIAYASSFGVSQIPAHAKTYYSMQLKKYTAIGVREKNAVKIISDLANMTSEWVIDPTLILSKEEWLKVAEPVKNIPNTFVLIYELTPCPYIIKLAKYIAQKANLQIVRLCKSAIKEDKDKSIIDITDAGPGEFLSIFDRAKFIVTNSFHGTAFSINFNKLFYTVITKRKQNNSRQKSLLELFSLQNRLLLEDASFPDIQEGIDYQHVNDVLSSEKEKAIKFITKYIQI